MLSRLHLLPITVSFLLYRTAPHVLYFSQQYVYFSCVNLVYRANLLGILGVSAETVFPQKSTLTLVRTFGTTRLVTREVLVSTPSPLPATMLILAQVVCSLPLSLIFCSFRKAYKKRNELLSILYSIN